MFSIDFVPTILLITFLFVIHTTSLPKRKNNAKNLHIHAESPKFVH